jgi:hypothetical protein
MRKAKRITESARNEFNEVERQELRSFLATSLIGIALTLFATALSFYVSKSKSPVSNTVSSDQTSIYFGLGISLFVLIIVGVASFIRYTNREVILLKRRLGGIYLSALEQSALNPLKPPTPHD